MEHHSKSNTIQKIFIIKISANEPTLEHITSQFIEDSISNELADSFLSVDNWEIEEVIDQDKTFKNTEQSEAKTNFFDPSDCCILSDPRKWKEELNLLYEIFDLEDLSRMSCISSKRLEQWHDDESEPDDFYKDQIHELFIKIKNVGV